MDKLLEKFVKEAQKRGFELEIVKDFIGAVRRIQETLKKRDKILIPASLKKYFNEPGFMVPQNLEACKGVNLAVCYAIYASAETGTLVFKADEETPRCLTLLPEELFVLLKNEQIKPTFKEIFREINRHSILNFYFISGPSSTADIEKVLIKGVHGPSEVKIFIYS